MSCSEGPPTCGSLVSVGTRNTNERPSELVFCSLVNGSTEVSSGPERPEKTHPSPGITGIRVSNNRNRYSEDLKKKKKLLRKKDLDINFIFLWEQPKSLCGQVVIIKGYLAVRVMDRVTSQLKFFTGIRLVGLKIPGTSCEFRVFWDP